MAVQHTQKRTARQTQHCVYMSRRIAIYPLKTLCFSKGNS